MGDPWIRQPRRGLLIKFRRYGKAKRSRRDRAISHRPKRLGASSKQHPGAVFEFADSICPANQWQIQLARAGKMSPRRELPIDWFQGSSEHANEGFAITRFWRAKFLILGRFPKFMQDRCFHVSKFLPIYRRPQMQIALRSCSGSA